MAKNYYDEKYQQSRLAVFDRDLYICQSCDKDCSKSLIECHHVDRTLDQEKLNNIENLITICPDCHDIITILEHKGYGGWRAFEQVEMLMKYNIKDHDY